MSFIIGVLVVIVLPMFGGAFIDSKWCRRSIARRNRRDMGKRLFQYWLLGLLPVLGLVFIFVFFSLLGKGLLFLI